MKLRIVKNNNKFVIQRQNWWGEWKLLTAPVHWRWTVLNTSDWEFFHYKFDTIQDAEHFVEQLKSKGRDAWIAWQPTDAEVIKEYLD